MATGTGVAVVVATTGVVDRHRLHGAPRATGVVVATTGAIGATGGEH